MNNIIVGIGIAIGVSFFILYNRKKKWLKPDVVWLICTVLLFIGIIGVIYPEYFKKYVTAFPFGFFTPIIYWTFDRIFKRISENLKGRDFILYLRNSNEINNGLGANNSHVKVSDKLFSFGLLIIIIGTLFIGIKYLMIY